MDIRFRFVNLTNNNSIPKIMIAKAIKTNPDTTKPKESILVFANVQKRQVRITVPKIKILCCLFFNKKKQENKSNQNNPWNKITFTIQNIQTFKVECPIAIMPFDRLSKVARIILKFKFSFGRKLHERINLPRNKNNNGNQKCFKHLQVRLKIKSTIF
eukprot:TRINITY_DN15397_c0_g1_i3.p4 TRINITY_DN15397_c0_g1~~TRINITY_DN15397_c0_g1_i3.p4  ORF type:complete len:158 (+),score=10.00 TRINITY_DN15397_c0_g1_i3:267-740(+)